MACPTKKGIRKLTKTQKAKKKIYPTAMIHKARVTTAGHNFALRKRVGLNCGVLFHERDLSSQGSERKCEENVKLGEKCHSCGNDE